jgi:hypothetical protein
VFVSSVPIGTVVPSTASAPSLALVELSFSYSATASLRREPRPAGRQLRPGCGAPSVDGDILIFSFSVPTIDVELPFAGLAIRTTAHE